MVLGPGGKRILLNLISDDPLWRDFVDRESATAQQIFTCSSRFRISLKRVFSLPSLQPKTQNIQYYQITTTGRIQNIILYPIFNHGLGRSFRDCNEAPHPGAGNFS